MSNNLYFLSKNRAVEMSENLYESEDILQELIAENPRLVLRDTDQDGAKLMLIAREYTVEEGDRSSNSYSLDHLFVDQNGTPVLVEVKRSTDTRIRREVIAQMMDYASRVSTWNVDELRSLFRENNKSDEMLEAYDNDDFWGQVATCLKAERVKLVFAADSIPNTLKTLIEFLDRNMKDIEVYGVEVHQYKTADATLLSTNIIANSTVEERKAIVRGSEWDIQRFSAQLLSFGSQELVEAAQDVLTFSQSIGMNCKFGSGAKYGNYTAKIGSTTIFKCGAFEYSSGFKCTIELGMLEILARLGEDWDEGKLRTLLTRFPNISEARDKRLLWDTPQYLYIDLRLLVKRGNMDSFKESIQALCRSISEQQNYHILPPPKNGIDFHDRGG